MTEFIEAGDFSVDAESRTVRGLLLPWNELSRLSSSKTAPIKFERGTVTIPADVSIVSANRNHDKYDPVGRALSIEDTDKGIVAEFSIARTPEGDEFLEQHKTGAIRKLSAEIAGIVRNGPRAVTARLTGAAFVSEGAFESAALFALGDVTEEQPADDATEDLSDVPTDELEARIAALTAELVTRADEPAEDAPASEGTPAEFSASESESGTPANAERGHEMAEAVVPNNEEKPADFSANKVFDLVTTAKSAEHIQNRQTADMALQDITPAIAAPGVLQPAWLGEVWSGVAPTRRYAGLIKNGNIVAFEEKGFKLSTGAELVQPWGGNKAELPSGTATTSIISGEPLQRWAFAADFAQEFFLIEAGRPVVEAFIREVFYSYARVSDKYALQRIYAAAGAAVEVDNFPADYNSALAKLIQGVDTIDDSDVSPTFAVVAPDVWTTLRRTPKDELPEFVTFTANRQDGTADGVQIVRDKAGVLGAGEVLVGSSQAAHLNELAGSPIQIDAVDIAHGGIDKSVIGMAQYMTEYPDGFVVIGDAE